ncbi:MAG: germination protein YpeB [Oscillospiraceae bacterium]|nr:germination protein YpeB [Oscillospiraceae bacterium]
MKKGLIENMFNISKRVLVRIIAFPAAIIAALAVTVITESAEVKCVRIELHGSQMRAAAEFSHCLESIEETLLKVRYSNCSQMKGELLAELYNYAASTSDKMQNGETSCDEIKIITQKEPLMLSGGQIISEAEALEIATGISGAPNLALISEEAGGMPSYVFANSSTTIAVTKAGGHLSYMLGYREVEVRRITATQAVRAAEIYLERLGIIRVVEIFHEIHDDVCIVYFAGAQAGITLYPDFIRVAVAMDTGEVLSVDKRDWLANHHPTGRDVGEPALSIEEARALISPLLTVESAKLCITAGDVFCYEFRCFSEDGRQVFVYINANTGREEQILLNLSDIVINL